MTNRTRRLYIGVTNDLIRRVYEHKHRLVPGFTSKYFLDRLVYFQDTDDISAAIAREKELKGLQRESLRGDPSPPPSRLLPASPSAASGLRFTGMTTAARQEGRPYREGESQVVGPEP